MASECPISKTKAIVEALGDDRFYVDCRVCGVFSITNSAYEFLRGDESSTLLPYLSAYIKQANTRGEKPLIQDEDWKDYAFAHRGTPVSGKLVKLLEYLAGRSPQPGQWIEVNESEDYPLFDAHDAKEVIYLLDALRDAGDIDRATAGGRRFRVAPKGWTRLDPIGSGRSGVCFVARWSDQSMDAAFDAIRKSVEDDCGLTILDGDSAERNDQVTDRIVAGIRSAQFTIADVTGQRPAVYFAGAYAMALGRQVIWTCREDELALVHVDPRQFSHIAWTDEAQLRVDLTNRIRATVLTPMKRR
jgi:hypothetical protein